MLRFYYQTLYMYCSSHLYDILLNFHLPLILNFLVCRNKYHYDYAFDRSQITATELENVSRI